MIRNKGNKNLFYRSLELDRAKVDEEKRSVEVSFSSEAPVRRWFGDEVLLHGSGNVDLARLRSMGAALLNHNPSVIVGPLKNIKVEDKRGKATIVFDDDEDGERAFKKVKSGSLKGMSVGYLINKALEVKEDEKHKGIKGPAIIALRWTPYEISLTPIPADASVGVGRSLEGIEFESIQNDKEGTKMTEDEIRKLFKDLFRDATSGLVSEIITKLKEEAKPKARIELETFNDLLGRAGAISPELKGTVAEMYANGKTEREITNAIMDEIAKKKSDAEDTTGSQSDGGIDQKSKTTTSVRVTDIKQVDDETLWRSICNPALLALS